MIVKEEEEMDYSYGGDCGGADDDGINRGWKVKALNVFRSVKIMEMVELRKW